MMYTKNNLILAVLLTITFLPFTSFAEDLSYGFIESRRGDNEILVEYDGPDTKEAFVCDVEELTCSSVNDDDEFRPVDALEFPLTVSPNGDFAILTLSSMHHALLTVDDYTLKLIPRKGGDAIQKILWSRDGKKAILVGSASVTSYDTSSGAVVTQAAQLANFLLLASPSGRFVAYHDDLNNAHVVLDMNMGMTTRFTSETPAYFEVSENGSFGAYREVVNDADVLRIVSLPNGTPATASSRAYTIDDYIFHENKVYFTANSKSDPLEWSLRAYDPVARETDTIDENISYGDYMKSFGRKLLYHKVLGEHSDIWAYDPDDDTKAMLPALGTSPAREGLRHEVIEAGGRSAVLVDDGDDDEKPLVIWLHGGPQRQTSINYHSYISYAVYDEMLERLAEGGARVVKLDYIGSTGYGKSFQDGLNLKMGVTDVKDVEDAIEDLTDEYDTDGVYLVGNSYGGYLGLKYLVEEGDVDGVVSINGVTDWEALIRDIPTSIFAKSFGGVPSFATKQYYDAAAIIPHLGDVDEDTEIVVAYGTNDTTIPNRQSTTFIAAADAADLSLDVLVMEGEDHTLKKRSTLNSLCKKVASMIDVSTRVCR